MFCDHVAIEELHDRLDRALDRVQGIAWDRIIGGDRSGRAGQNQRHDDPQRPAMASRGRFQRRPVEFGANRLEIPSPSRVIDVDPECGELLQGVSFDHGVSSPASADRSFCSARLTTA